MTKDKERDDAMIAEAERLADRDWSGDQTYAQFFAPILLELQRSGWKPKPDRAEVLARDVLLAWSGYQQLTDEEARSEDFAKACRFTQTALAELRAEWEAERPVIEVPIQVKAWAEGIGSVIPPTDEVREWIKSLDGAKGDE